jgi:hyperosmotically inducible protein
MNKASSAADSTSAAIDSSVNKVSSMADSAGKSIDSSMKKADKYMDDSATTAKVKSALLAEKTITSPNISVKTSQGVVTLNGAVASEEQGKLAVETAGKVEGVQSVVSKLEVKETKTQAAKNYAGDTATTSELKAKLLADDIVPSRNVQVSTNDGVVQLSGTVKTKAQSERAESIAKSLSGVKSVTNNLVVKS